MHFCTLAVHLGRRHGLTTACDLYDHYYDFASHRLPFFRPAFEWALRRSDINIAFTEEIVPIHRRRSPRARYEVIPPSLDRRVFRPMDRAACRQQLGLSSEGTLIGYCGAVKAIRGLDTLVEAVTRLRREGHEVTLVVAGPEDGSLQLDGLEGVITLGHLPQTQVPVVLNACNLNVECRQAISAADYCFPHKTIEYIACGVPLLMPDVQSMARYLADYPEYLYRTADAADLAAKIVALLAQSEYRYPSIESWSELAVRYEALLRDAVGSAEET
jgi:glycosyltransferase involved in cell wall biosynthesis